MMKETYSDGSPLVDPASSRATLANVQISFDAIRTTKKDPQSSKVFCEGQTKIVFSPDLLQRANEARSMGGDGSISQLASVSLIDVSANVFSKATEYSVQPTDDGTQVYTEMTNSKAISDFVAEVSMYAILKPLLEAKIVADQKANMEALAKKAIEDERLRQENAAEVIRLATLKAEEEKVSMDSAMEENAASHANLNSLWNGRLDEEQRNIIMNAQRAWIKERNVKCEIEAVEETPEGATPNQIALTRLECDTRETKKRTLEILKTFPLDD